MTNIKDQTLALASMMQSAAMIIKLANGEKINQAAFDCSLDSLFTLDAKTTDDIYGHGEGLIKGLKTLFTYLTGANKKPDQQLAYYVLSMMKLQAKMTKDSQMIDKIQKGISDIHHHAVDFDMSQTAKIHQIDGLYQKTISLIKPRIMVQGDQFYLSNSDTTSKVRALLFAGIRAAVLWHQKGGSRFKLIIYRKKYIQQVTRLLEKF